MQTNDAPDSSTSAEPQVSSMYFWRGYLGTLGVLAIAWFANPEPFFDALIMFGELGAGITAICILAARKRFLQLVPLLVLAVALHLGVVSAIKASKAASRQFVDSMVVASRACTFDREVDGSPEWAPSAGGFKRRFGSVWGASYRLLYRQERGYSELRAVPIGAPDDMYSRRIDMSGCPTG